MTLDWDGKIRMDCSSPSAMASLIAMKDRYQIATGNDADSDRHGIVTPDGHVGMMFIGQVKVAGLTLEQATQLLEEKLAKYIRNPKVGIAPYEIHSETVSIAGAVAKPGMYTISNGMRLADLFAMAGGAATRLFDGQVLDATDFNKSVFLRHNQVIPLSFNLLMLRNGLKLFPVCSNSAYFRSSVTPVSVTPSMLFICPSFSLLML